MSARALLHHASLFLLLSAGIALVLSAYGEDDPRKILRASVRRWLVFAAGTATLALAMAILERTLLSPG